MSAKTDSSKNSPSTSSSVHSSAVDVSRPGNSASANSTDDSNPEDLDLFVKELMDNMQTRFSRLSDTILGRIDDMGSKIDELEKNINELVEQTGAEVPPSDETATSISGGNKRYGDDVQF